MGLDQPYQKVADAEEFQNLKEQPDQGTPAPMSWKKQTVLISLALGTLLVGILTAIAARTSKHAASAPSDSTTTTTVASIPSATIHPIPTATSATEVELGIQDCGVTPAQAREKGCVYDVMMQLWTPAACYDGVLSERFLAEGNWTWYKDPLAAHVFSDEEIKLGEHDRVYVSANYHKTHCIFAWEKLIRALRTDSPLIEQLISYDHAMHCRHKALAAEDAKGAIAPTGYTKCAPYKTWMKALPADKMSSVD